MTQPSNLEQDQSQPAPRFEVDMSAEAIDRRLREVAMLWDFWRYLRNFKPAEQDRDTQER